MISEIHYELLFYFCINPPNYWIEEIKVVPVLSPQILE